MDLIFSPEQEAYRAAIRQFLEKNSAEPAVRELMATERGYDPPVWAAMAEQLGLQALLIPEDVGGAGFGFVELIVVMEELGRSLACVPYFATAVLGVSALLAAGDDPVAAELLPRIASGELVTTLAVSGESGSWDPADVATTATLAADGWALTGQPCYVIDGASADEILVVARGAAGLSLFAVSGSADGLTRESLETMDQTRKQARLTLAAAPARLVGAEGAGKAILASVRDHAAAALAAEQVGGAQRCLDMAVEYAKTRVQFGRPIGSFQAVKHRCADMYVALESARSAAYYAGWCAATDPDRLPIAASIAKAYCSEAYDSISADNIHVHGGIGFTWEHSAHLYFKRAKTSRVLFGDPAYHYERLAQLLGV